MDLSTALITMLEGLAGVASKWYLGQKLTDFVAKRRGEPIGSMDLLIGAHARSRGIPLVTHNTREFQRVDRLILEDWTVA